MEQLTFRGMKRKHLVYVLCCLFTLSACTKEVEIDIPGYEEQIVIDGRIETGYPPIVLISKSKDIYAPTDLNAFLSGFVSGATVTVSNGTTTVTLIEICTDNLPPGTEPFVAAMLGIDENDLSSVHICGYTSFDPQIFGEVGKTYDLTILAEGQTFTASTKIVEPTSFNSVFWKPDGNLANYGYSWANLSDIPGQYDAYMWEVKRINKDASGNEKDANFKKNWSPVFDDEFFDGLTFDFFYDNPFTYDDGTPDEYAGLFPQGDTIVIKFSKMDDKVFEFMEKKFTQLGTAGNPFATPTNIPTNITGGALGIWAGYSPTFDTLACQP
ncbi:MAG: hypothetical protein A3D92_16900 [Bacteroidetes bacterium RIFCSPHIGHO2_02_FULL_44_7]|nr:MAG: hypothetical protein A3D92_16900 [Bacteroidetes bacterium RIFCSPHIGHO2_02_FULL_44_7]